MSQRVLVTGGTGFVGMHILLQLMKQDYEVRTTVRSLKSKDKVIDTLRAHGIKNFQKLSFVETDLSSDKNWDKAMEGCDYVLSVASPVFMTIPKDENEAIRPAVEGIQRVLKAARNAKVKRVVMTSNFGAVGFSRRTSSVPTTEGDWTDPGQKGLSIYEKSKLLAEMAAWDFMEKEGGDLEFTTINPVAIFGPALSSHISGSFVLFDMILSGKPYPNLPLNIVDVRDVADLHIRAMTNEKANGQRFIASADGQISMSEIATVMKNKGGSATSSITSRTIPKFVIHAAGLFNSHAREGSSMLRVNRNVSNEKAKTILGWKPIATNVGVVEASITSMIKYGIVK